MIKSHYFTITAASGSLYQTNEQANRKYSSYFRLSKHNETDRRKIHVPLQIKSQKNSYKKKNRERFKIRDRGAIPGSNREDRSRN